MNALTRSTPPAASRTLVIAGVVVVLHVGALWALHSGLARRVVETVVPVEVLSQLIEPPRPQVEPPPPAPRPAPAPQAVPRSPSTPPPAPQPLAITDPTPAPQAPVGVLAPPAPLPPVSAPVAAPAAVSAAPAVPAPAPAAPARIELPSSDAEYLNNPKPAYPAISRRMGEQGKVIVRAYIGTDGSASRAEVRQSSGYPRLDEAAVQTVLRWRYVPGKRGGVPEAMWFNIPINFVLE